MKMIDIKIMGFVLGIVSFTILVLFIIHLPNNEVTISKNTIAKLLGISWALINACVIKVALAIYRDKFK
jgi:hypothetical protein